MRDKAYFDGLERQYDRKIINVAQLCKAILDDWDSFVKVMPSKQVRKAKMIKFAMKAAARKA